MKGLGVAQVLTRDTSALQTMFVQEKNSDLERDQINLKAVVHMIPSGSTVKASDMSIAFCVLHAPIIGKPIAVDLAMI